MSTSHFLMELPMCILPMLTRTSSRYIVIYFFVTFFTCFTINKIYIGFNCFIIFWGKFSFEQFHIWVNKIKSWIFSTTQASGYYFNWFHQLYHILQKSI